SEPGYLFYIRDNALVAQRFDLRQKALIGEPHTLTDAVQYFSIIDLGVFDAGKGILVSENGSGAAKSQLMWFERSGKHAGAAEHNPQDPSGTPVHSGTSIFRQIDSKW